ncbi:MAG: hypothetical protein AB8B97_00790 [Granulosicoccus sp.]
MYNLIKISGLVLLLAYCYLNLGNILYFKLDVNFVGIALAGIAGVYVFQRMARASVTGLKVSGSEVMGLCLLGLGFTVVTLQRIFYDTYIGFDGNNIQESLQSIWIVSSLWFLIGGSFAAASLKESPVLALLIAGSVTAIMVFGVDAELFQSYKSDDFDQRESRISHLNVERYIVIPMILAYALSPKTRWIVALCGIVCLFLLGGRTALFVFILTLTFMNLGGNILRNAVLLLIVGGALFGGLRYAVGNGIINPDNEQVSEMLFLGGVSEDNSFNARVQLLQESLQDLPEQFLVGNFSITAERYGDFGTYIHNILSAWQFYGFFMFFGIVACLIYCAITMFTEKRASSPMMVFSSFILVYVLISVVLSKYVGWTMLWFAMGLWMLRPVASKLRMPNSSNSNGRKKRRRRRVYTSGFAT